jgi:hypothetical protein
MFELKIKYLAMLLENIYQRKYFPRKSLFVFDESELSYIQLTKVISISVLHSGFETNWNTLQQYCHLFLPENFNDVLPA